MDKHESIEAQWKCIIRLGRECYEDIDYDHNGSPIIPPLSSILQDMQPVLNETNNIPTAIPLEEPIFDTVGNGTNEFESNTSPEGVSPSRESDREEEYNFSEGVSEQEGVRQPTETINDSAPIDIVENSDKGRPCRNIGTYEDGPANIRKFPIEGESYDYSFVSNFDDQFLVLLNCTNIQTKYYPSQKITKSLLAECYLLQDTWITDENCLHSI